MEATCLTVLEKEKAVSSTPTLYRGHEGMWMWIVHRTTGVGIFFFLLVHVLDTSLVRLSPEAYNDVIGSYKTPIYGLIEPARRGHRAARLQRAAHRHG